MHLLHRLLFIFIFISGFSIYGQDELDSLKKIVNNKNLHDTIRLQSIAQIINNNPISKEKDYYVEMLGAISKKNYEKPDNEPKEFYAAYLSSYYNEMGVRYGLIDLKKSVWYYDKAIQFARLANDDEGANFCIISKGAAYFSAGNQREAINNFFEALRFFENEEEKDYDAIAYVYSHLSTVYQYQKDYEMAIIYLNKAISSFEQKLKSPGYNADMGDEIQKYEYQNNLGTIYQKLKKYSQAEAHFKESEAISKGIGYNTYTSIALAKQGILKSEQKDYQVARKLLEQAHLLSDNELSESFSSIHLGRVLHLQGFNHEALKYVLSGVALVEKNQRVDLQEEAYELLYLINKELGDYKASHEYYEKFRHLKDSAENKEISYLLKKKELEYDYEKKELALKLKTEQENARKNYILFGLGGLLLVLIIVSYFLYRNYKHKQSIAGYEKRDLNQKLLLGQMNPHFIFNSVDNIQSLIHLNQTDDAIFYLNKFARLTRQVLENSGENYIEFAEEIAMIDNYLNIQKLLYNNIFDFYIETDEELETENLFIPPMLIQPFIENAIKHGVANMENGIIRIHFKLREGKLIVEISDNGVGLTENNTLKTHKSMSTKITQERLSLLNRSENSIIHYEDNNPGTKVWFEVPHIYET